MTTDLELPIFRPRMGGGPGSRSSVDGTRSFRNALRARIRAGSSRSGRTEAQVHPLQANARRVVIKAHVQRMGPSGAKAAALHVRYIERDGVEKDGSKGVLYGPDGPVRARTFEQPRPGEKHQFRFIISPEDGSELELTAYVRRLMATLERDVGRPVEWAAVNHYDTSHPHAHVVIRGIDRDGPDDPDRVEKLRELERRGIGAVIAARSGMTFLARVPEDFRGRIQPAERAGPPGDYAVVSDGQRFVVLRSTPALRALQGQSVAIARDAKGRLIVRPGPDHDIGR